MLRTAVTLVDPSSVAGAKGTQIPSPKDRTKAFGAKELPRLRILKGAFMGILVGQKNEAEVRPFFPKKPPKIQPAQRRLSAWKEGEMGRRKTTKLY